MQNRTLLYEHDKVGDAILQVENASSVGNPLKTKAERSKNWKLKAHAYYLGQDCIT